MSLNERQKAEQDENEVKQIEETKEENTTNKLSSQRFLVKKKTKMIHTFMGDSIVVKMPKFMKEDYFEKKCQDILKFEDSSIEKRVKNFWDPYPFLKLRKLYNKYTT